MNEPTTIRTERLLLRPFSFNDVEDVLAYAADPGFLPLPSTAKPVHDSRCGGVRRPNHAPKLGHASQFCNRI